MDTLLKQTPTGSNTDEMISRQRLRTKESEQEKVEDEGKYLIEAMQGHPLCSFDSIMFVCRLQAQNQVKMSNTFLQATRVLISTIPIE